MDNHEYFMSLALKEAKLAYKKDETPIGAVIVKDGKVIAKAHNLRETKNNALYHAEILAINKACKKLGSWRLIDCDLYVTLEPCLMCAGAIIQSRIKNVYYGASDPKGGAFGSSINLNEITTINHHPNINSGILKEECGQILKDFFKKKRENK